MNIKITPTSRVMVRGAGGKLHRLSLSAIENLSKDRENLPVGLAELLFGKDKEDKEGKEDKEDKE